MLLASILILPLSGCKVNVGGDGKSAEQHNDELRRANMELRRAIDATQEKIVLLESELTGLRRETFGEMAVQGAVVPVLSGLRFARYTGPIDTDGDGVDDELRLFLLPVDQFGRMLVIAGKVNVQAVQLVADQPPRVVLDRTISPQEFQEAYRTGLTGDHFSFTLPLSAQDIAGVTRIVVQATLTQADTGQVVTAQQGFALRGS